MSAEEDFEQLHARSSRVTFPWAATFLFLILFLGIVSIYQYLQLQKLEKRVATLEGENTYQATQIGTIQYKVDYITPLAENANQYAHSHPYSDIRLKKNIQEIENPISNLLLLRGVSFEWDTESYPELMLGNDHQYGLIAQDVEKVFPELVSTDIRGYKQVDYAKLTPILIEAIRDQQYQINQLEEQINKH